MNIEDESEEFMQKLSDEEEYLLIRLNLAYEYDYITAGENYESIQHLHNSTIVRCRVYESLKLVLYFLYKKQLLDARKQIDDLKNTIISDDEFENINDFSAMYEYLEYIQMWVKGKIKLDKRKQRKKKVK